MRPLESERKRFVRCLTNFFKGQEPCFCGYRLAKAGFLFCLLGHKLTIAIGLKDKIGGNGDA